MNILILGGTRFVGRHLAEAALGRDTGPIWYVVGKCTFPTPGFSVALKPHTPRGADSKVLLLDAIVHAPSNLVPPQVPTDVNVRYELHKGPTTYERVIILPDNLVLTAGKAH